MSNASALHLSRNSSRDYQALVLGRAGLDLYPQPDGAKTRDATSFSADMGGSAGNIAVAMAKAGARVGLISGLSKDAVGDFVRNRLVDYGVDVGLITSTTENQRTSLALAEVRNEDCEVVIYRNNPADLGFEITESVEQAVCNSSHLVVTGTSLIDEASRANVFRLMTLARENNCNTWLDLDYRAWNWPSLELTRQVYREAAALSRVLIGNEEEFEVLSDNLTQLIEDCRNNNQILLLKRGAEGSSLFAGKSKLDSGIYPLKPVKPYGSGDAFVGNLLVNYTNSADWQQAVEAGSAAAALVVSQRGCASAMPTPKQLESLQQRQTMHPAANWS
jgi:5-dehydro-2-deoxygluconokinase